MTLNDFQIIVWIELKMIKDKIIIILFKKINLPFKITSTRFGSAKTIFFDFLDELQILNATISMVFFYCRKDSGVETKDVVLK